MTALVATKDNGSYVYRVAFEDGEPQAEGSVLRMLVSEADSHPKARRCILSPVHVERFAVDHYREWSFKALVMAAKQRGARWIYENRGNRYGWYVSEIRRDRSKAHFVQAQELLRPWVRTVAVTPGILLLRSSVEGVRL